MPINLAQEYPKKKEVNLIDFKERNTKVNFCNQSS